MWLSGMMFAQHVQDIELDLQTWGVGICFNRESEQWEESGQSQRRFLVDLGEN